MVKAERDIRFHAGVYSKLNGKTHPAMLVIARDAEGNIKAVQATYLDPLTHGKVDKSEVAIQKQTFGVMKGAAVTIRGNKHAPTLIAEGIETALSLKQALPDATVKVTLSKANFKNIDPETLTAKTIFCLDCDGQDLKKDKVIHDATKRLLEANKQVAFMVPATHQQQKIDYNDVLKTSGVKSIQHDFKHAISVENFYGKGHELTLLAANKTTKLVEKATQIYMAKQQNHIQHVNYYQTINKENSRSELPISPTKSVDMERSL